jgi:hypothetical protein
MAVGSLAERSGESNSTAGGDTKQNAAVLVSGESLPPSATSSATSPFGKDAGQVGGSSPFASPFGGADNPFARRGSHVGKAGKDIAAEHVDTLQDPGA